METDCLSASKPTNLAVVFIELLSKKAKRRAKALLLAVGLMLLILVLHEREAAVEYDYFGLELLLAIGLVAGGGHAPFQFEVQSLALAHKFLLQFRRRVEHDAGHEVNALPLFALIPAVPSFNGEQEDLFIGASDYSIAHEASG